MTHFHVIKDPVHGTMQFTSQEDAWVKPFIDSAHVQRLRHIKQMGLSDYIFPGATHTRFNHSLGCCYVASQIAHKIGLTPTERQLVMIACLLHDIGHGPFSHSFEGLFPDKKIRHEDWTPFFLADYHQENFFANYNKKNPDHPLNQEKFQQIAAMIMHKNTNKNVLADIVSSQLDADRLDYLLRDNHFCGVGYGEFDLRWMLHSLAIIPTSKGNRLGITHKGIGVTEHYLMARRLMVRNIYHQQKTLALEFLLIQLLAQIARLLTEQSNLKNIAETRLGKFLIAVYHFNQQKIINETAKLTFLQTQYESYKQLCDYDLHQLITQIIESPLSHPIAQLAERLHYRILPKMLRISQHVLTETDDALTNFKLTHQNDFAPWQINLIRTPHQAYSGEEDPILVMDEQGQIEPLSHFSLLIKNMADKFEQGGFICIDHAIENHQLIQKFLHHIKTLATKTYA